MREQRSSTLDWTRLCPPPYLLGVCLLIWGLFSDQILLGMVAALVLEGHRKVGWRFSFSNQDYVRIWNLCVALFLTVAVFQVVGQEVGRWQITRSFQKWMPMLLFPMILAQYYSKGLGMPITTFSLVARRKRLIDERAGRRVAPPNRAHLGYFYFGVLLLSIGLVAKDAPRLGQLLGTNQRIGIGAMSSLYVIAGLLVSWALSVFVPRARRTMAGILVILAMVLGYKMQLGLRQLHHIVEQKTNQWLSGRYGGDAHHSRTSFGEIGRLKLSPKVFWRVKHLEGKRPNLLTEAIYDIYIRQDWSCTDRRNQAKRLTPNDDERSEWELYKLKLTDTTCLLEISGRAAETQLIPRQEEAAQFGNLLANRVDSNALGTIIAEPRYSVIRYTVNSGPLPPGFLESLPHGQRDLETPGREEEAIVRVVENEIGLTNDLSTRDAIRKVESWFLHPDNHFKYSRHLRGTGAYYSKSVNGPVGHFLETSRSGHCEFYATATVLLLRKMGIPARYAVGYAINEVDPKTKEYVLRGVHRHAWARVWVAEDQRWVDVDTTPSNWFDEEKREMTTLQRMVDRWEHWMLSWNLWRRDDNKGLLWSVLPLLLAGALLIVVVLRLVRGLRNSKAPVDNATSPDNDALTILGMDSAWFELEQLLAQRVKKRRDAQPVADWCRELSWLRPDLRSELPPLLAGHYQYRFDPKGLTKEARQTFQDSVMRLLEKLHSEAEQRD